MLCNGLPKKTVIKFMQIFYFYYYLYIHNPSTENQNDIPTAERHQSWLDLDYKTKHIFDETKRSSKLT